MTDLIKEIYFNDSSKRLIEEIKQKIDFHRLKYYNKYFLKLIESMNEKEIKEFNKKIKNNHTARSLEKLLFKYFYKYSVKFIKKDDFNKNKKKEPKDIVKKRVQKYREKNKDLKSLQIMVEPDIKYAFDMVKKTNNVTGQELLRILLKKAGFLK